MSVKIIIDSASDIDEKQALEMGVEMIPMSIIFGDKEYLSGVDLSSKEFYEKLIESNTLPKTSQINEYRWTEVFEKHVNNGDEVVAIVISSKLSATYDSAKKASLKFKGKVHVIDSLNVAIGERLLLDYALRLVGMGKLAQEIADELNEKKLKINLMAVLGTLEYLKKGGRISAAVAFAGKLLTIKPVVAVVDGKVKLIGKAMGSKNGNNLLNKMVTEKGGIDFSMPFGVIYSGLDDSVVNKYVEDSSHLWKDNTDNVPKHVIGATIGTHVGPGAVGVAFFEK